MKTQLNDCLADALGCLVFLVVCLACYLIL